MKKVLIFLFAIICAYLVVYLATRMAIEHTVRDIVAKAVSDEFTLQELKWNVYTNF